MKDHKETWAAIAKSVLADEPYTQFRFEFAPQLGLVPIGKDPNSGLWEFVHLQSGELPGRDAEGKLVLQEASGIVLVLIPRGTFYMGAVPKAKAGTVESNIDNHAQPDEAPVHRVSLAPFFISKYPMTQAQWLRMTGENPSGFRPGTERGGNLFSLQQPVENVSWISCSTVLSRLQLALPTEAQWEYACRAGTATIWWTGNDSKDLYRGAHIDRLRTHPAPVGSLEPNKFGLYDMSGNVQEWCQDWYANNAYELAVNRLTGERKVDIQRGRVFRGGTFEGPAHLARSAQRRYTSPHTRMDIIGVRPARMITNG